MRVIAEVTYLKSASRWSNHAKIEGMPISVKI